MQLPVLPNDSRPRWPGIGTQKTTQHYHEYQNHTVRDTGDSGHTGISGYHGREAPLTWPLLPPPSRLSLPLLLQQAPLLLVRVSPLLLLRLRVPPLLLLSPPSPVRLLSAIRAADHPALVSSAS